jgi:uncharacterized protein YdiU (UPF0061 family)
MKLFKQSKKIVKSIMDNTRIFQNSNYVKKGEEGLNTNSVGLRKLSEIGFENSHLKNLFIRTLDNPKKSQQTKQCNYSKVEPTPVDKPYLICLSELCCNFLNIDYKYSLEHSKETAEYLSGNKLISNSEPSAHCYCGHQFGIFAGQLGDGRAISLGDIYPSKNKDQLWDLQLKGSGLTPYSRSADGRAVLRSSIREFLCSEHLWALGIPTTRALSLVGSNSTAMRDPMYDGNVIYEKCCVVTRVAPTFFRFGSFEIFKPVDQLSGSAGPSVGLDAKMIPKMLEYLGQYHLPMIYPGEVNPDFMKEFFQLITMRTAILAALWQSYGFCHGVLNTDNMSILGLTIDFGPFGFMEYFDKNFICNHSDKHGRYAYMQQPKICKWNLLKLSEALDYAMDSKMSKQIIETFYDNTFENFYYFLMMKKLGFIVTNHPVRKEDRKFVDETFELLQAYGFDMTIFFRNLSNCSFEEEETKMVETFMKYSLPLQLKREKIRPSMNENMLKRLIDIKKESPMLLYSFGIDPEAINAEGEKILVTHEFEAKNYSVQTYEEDKRKSLTSWLEKYKLRLREEFKSIEKLEDVRIDFSNFFKEYDLKLHKEAYNNVLMKVCEEISENSTTIKQYKDFEQFNQYKKEIMNKLNPKFILRNHLAQKVIEKTEQGDLSEIYKVLHILTNPYLEHENEIFESGYDTSTLLAYDVCVSCSS